MFKEIVECKGKGCPYYGKYNVVQKSGTGWVPNFDLTEERCSHPTVTPQKKSFSEPDDVPGVSVNSLKRCPLGK